MAAKRMGLSFGELNTFTMQGFCDFVDGWSEGNDGEDEDEVVGGISDLFR